MKCQYIVVILYGCLAISFANLRITNIKCETFDPPFVTFEECYLKVLKRNVVGLNIYVKLYQLPVTNVSVNVALFKKASGYRPFLYNYTTDFCLFIKNRNKNPFLKIVHEFVRKDSNINHTCPYNHDIIVRNLVLQTFMFDRMPLPGGDYMLDILVGAYNQWKVEIKAYFAVPE